MITRPQALYLEKRFGVTVPTWLDANDLNPATAALARAVKAAAQRAMEARRGLAVLIRQTRLDLDAAEAALASGALIIEDLPVRPAVTPALKRLADREDELGPLVLALHDALNEPHP